MMRWLIYCYHGAECWLAWVLVVAPLVVVYRTSADEAQKADLEQTQADLDNHIASLIQQLGAPQYATRQKAKAELERLRLEAFDALNEAQLSDDIEIALSARYLVRSMQVNWWTDEDAPEVRQLLREYGNRPESERRNLMEQLAGLPLEKCLRPLCRLARYEASEHHSKRAALLTLSLEPPEEALERHEFASTILARAGKSKRVAADWLRAYADLLVDAPTADRRWNELIDFEEDRLTNNPSQTSKELTRDLLKWYADQLSMKGRQDQALTVMRKTINLLNSTREEVLDAVDWFRERKSWIIIAEIADRFPDTFKRSPMLQYRLAETYLRLGQQEKSDQIARQAMESLPEELDKHLEIAANLQHDGLFEWAEFEYRHVAKHMDKDPSEAVRAQLYLSEMLHEVSQEQAAAEVLGSLVKVVEAEDEIRKFVENDLGRGIAGIKSRMHFFQAQHYGEKQDFQRQRESLLEGINNDPHDADVLIAMYRVPGGDDAWRQETSERIREAADFFRQQIRELAARQSEARSYEDRAIAAFQLALSNNQLAWLIANTEGDFDEALSCSVKSLILQPNRSGFLDTLGRCYYAKGDYENAVKYQSQAVALEPHSPLIIAQLELFRQTLAQQKKADRKIIQPENAD